MKFLILAASLIVSIQTNADTNPYYDEYKIAIHKLMNNFLPNGGIVASPSTDSPNYYYDWVRDTALTMKTITELAYDPNIVSEGTITAEEQKNLKDRVTQWIDYEMARQKSATQIGLGVPLFFPNLKPNYDRDLQNDGPALRVLTAIQVANHWLDEGRENEVITKLYGSEYPDLKTLIKIDLEYIAKRWNDQSVDLWEEQKAYHYYTMIVQSVALRKGAEFAEKFNDSGAADYYLGQALNAPRNNMNELLNEWFYSDSTIIPYDHEERFSTASRHRVGENDVSLESKLDISVVLAALHTAKQFGNQPMYTPNDKTIATINLMMDSFEKLYPINGIKKDLAGHSLGVALGRYVHDAYNGINNTVGNPWFLTTLAVAEYACLLHTPVSLHVDPVKQFNRVLYHSSLGVTNDGSLAEEFDRTSGKPTGARDLTWSYASYITAYRACKNLLK